MLEDWIVNVEELMGEDDDGGACPLLEAFDDDSGEDTLLERVDSYLARVSPSKGIVDEIATLAMHGTIRRTVGVIVSTWSEDTVTIQAQHSLQKLKNVKESKVRLLCRMYAEMLNLARWKPVHVHIYEAVNKILLDILCISKEYPYNKRPGNFNETVVHFKVKEFLAGASLNVWSMSQCIIPEKPIFGSSRPRVTKTPSSLIVPTLRRLGMNDLLDNQWSMYGSWDDILVELSRIGDEPPRGTSCDSILGQRSAEWRRSRNSLSCRNIARGPYSFGGSADQCFQYFPKCTVPLCTSVETPKKPHKYRCTECYYFHTCSDACAAYARMFQLHDCQLTPRDKVPTIKMETENYLGLNKPTKKEMKHSLCNFCGTLRENAPDCRLLQCGKCKRVAYCSQDCQAMDWAEHKKRCEKK